MTSTVRLITFSLVDKLTRLKLSNLLLLHLLLIPWLTLEVNQQDKWELDKAIIKVALECHNSSNNNNSTHSDTNSKWEECHLRCRTILSLDIFHNLNSLKEQLDSVAFNLHKRQRSNLKNRHRLEATMEGLVDSSQQVHLRALDLCLKMVSLT